MKTTRSHGTMVHGHEYNDLECSCIIHNLHRYESWQEIDPGIASRQMVYLNMLGDEYHVVIDASDVTTNVALVQHKRGSPDKPIMCQMFLNNLVPSKLEQQNIEVVRPQDITWLRDDGHVPEYHRWLSACISENLYTQLHEMVHTVMEAYGCMCRVCQYCEHLVIQQVSGSSHGPAFMALFHHVIQVAATLGMVEGLNDCTDETQLLL